MIQPLNRFQLPKVALAAGLALSTAIASIAAPVFTSNAQASFHESPKAVLDEVWQLIHENYVDDTFNSVDWQAVRMELLEQNYSSPEEAYDVLRSTLEQLEDPFTRFLDPEQYQSLTEQTSGELSGVGIRFQVDRLTQFPEITDTFENSPAADARLMQGDRIIAIDDQSTEGMTIQQVSDLIKGDEGTPITFTIRRWGRDEFEVVMTRAIIEVPSVRYSLQTEGPNRIGYIRLTEFSAHAPEQMAQAILDLTDQGVDGFVLDLRGNPGGLLNASIDISRMWINDGAIVSTVGRDGLSETTLANHTALTDQPLAVLVDQRSASSSEILTGALMDNDRAVVIGMETYGKALVQRVYNLSDGSGLAVTVAHYYTPDGTDISQLGITPDIEVEMTRGESIRLSGDPTLLGTGSDPFYLEAITSLELEILARRSSADPTELGLNESLLLQPQ